MAQNLDQRIRDAAHRIVERRGKVVTFHTKGEALYKPETVTTVRTGSEAIEVKVSPPAQYGTQLVDGKQITSEDVMVLLPTKGLTFEPFLGQRVEIDSRSWMIQSIKPSYSGELIAAYLLQLRKGQ